MRRLSIASARAIALAAQGFARPLPRAPGFQQFARVLSTLGLVQLDSVNVCVRSHYMPFYARLGPYPQVELDSWLGRADKHFEYWAHEASVMPIESYPLWRWKMATMQVWKSLRKTLAEHPRLKSDVLRQVRERGPLTIKELDAPRKRNQPWWGYGPGKVALEVLFAEGKLTALRGDNFTRRYDVPERSVPASILADRSYDQTGAHRALLISALAHLGVGSARDIADYYRLKMAMAGPLLEELADAGVAERVAIDGWRGPVYLHAAARRPRKVLATSLLSPFDPLCWFRDRAERLFDFHYRIEIYTPKEQRVHGYYVLPFLLDGELVGRVDLKADRKDKRLLVPSAFVEEGQEPERVAGALAQELTRFASWLGLETIEVGARGNLAARLRARM